MSDDPLGPGDWRDGDDEDWEELPDDAGDSPDADPFADVAADREGDPFEGFDGPAGGSPDASADESRAGGGEKPGGTRPDEGSDGGGPTDDASAWQPLPEVSGASEAHDPAGDDASPASGAGVSGGSVTPESGEGAEDPFGGPDPRGDPFEDEGVFERQEVGEIDPDDVWEALEATERAGGDEGRRYAEVSKHTYCERCEWFSDPPEVSCTHEGTEIVEFLDMETVRLLNCPVVAERRAIRNED
jgi:hypothetical protein